jgi:Tfp pilus assembly protein FimT
MTLQTGHKNARHAAKANLAGRQCPSGRSTAPGPRAFTLIELVLVMALLIVVLAIAFPSLSNFFRARNLDLEARRFVSLARYGQSRAVSEGVPAILWIDAKRRTYGLELQPGYTTEDAKAVEFDVDETLQVEVQTSTIVSRNAVAAQQTLPGLGKVPMIRFLPTGFIAETSPDAVIFRQGSDDAIWITQNANASSYEIQTNSTFYAHR